MLTITARLASVALLVVCAASCTRAGSSGPAGLHPWTDPNHLRIEMTASPNTLDPILATQESEAQVIGLAMDPLVATGPDGHAVPILAARVPTLENGDISKDGLAITYHLRHGVVWHDGAPFTSRDVQFSWQAVMNPKNLASTRHGYDQVSRVDTPDRYTAVFRLRRRFAPAVNTFFAHSDAPMSIVPAHLLARYADINRVPFNGQPIGTGPYKVVRWYRGDRVEFVANDRYFLGKPRIARITFRFVADENAIANAMRAHEVDWFYQATPQIYPQLKTIGGVAIRLQPFNGFDALMLNTSRPPFSDPALRRALALALDKRRLVDEITYGTTLPATEDIPRFMWAFDPAAGTTARDLPAARALLDSDGWRTGPDGVRQKGGQRLSIGIAYRSDSLTDRNRGVLIVSMLREAGIEAQLKGYNVSLLYGPQSEHGILASGTYDAGMLTWFAGTDPDDSTQFVCDQRPPAGYDWSRYCSREVDAAERDALAHYDIATRKADYAIVQRALARDDPYVFLWWPRAIEAYNDDLKGFRPNGLVDVWNAYAWRFGA